MCSVDRAVDAVPLIVPVCLQCLKQSGPRALLRPPIKPVEHRLLWPKLRWEISPWNARPPPPQDGFHELPIVISPATWAPLVSQDRSELRPLPVVQLESNHRLPMEHRRHPMESNFPPSVPLPENLKREAPCHPALSHASCREATHKNLREQKETEDRARARARARARLREDLNSGTGPRWLVSNEASRNRGRWAPC